MPDPRRCAHSVGSPGDRREEGVVVKRDRLRALLSDTRNAALGWTAGSFVDGERGIRAHEPCASITETCSPERSSGSTRCEAIGARVRRCGLLPSLRT